ncbi:hypothetical protein KSF_067320 [Reticulibacter mediterranei]|uniref:Peroxidase n=1 Tax=Reticulibacter mediterranei TaxID=2778369 RepID=A0A8J3N325_9CHLR|nr:hypothetical protein [Reticulibacter mediterranei]GHO96684.1 hypothetical protein KSF_067320 [Reticulibacter mediterranei]
MAHQVALTVIARIKPDETEALKQLLKAMNVNAAQNDLIPFGTFSTIHFARLLVLDQAIDLDGGLIAPELVLIGECDAPLDRVLKQLVNEAGEGLDRIYQHCEGYSTGSKITPAQRLAYLRANMVRSQAFYVNTVGRTVQQIHQEAQLREAIQCFLDRSDWSHSSALEVRTKILAYVRGDSTLNWAIHPPAPPSILFRFKETLHLVVVPLLLLILLPLLIPLFVVWLVLLRIHELSDAAPDVKPDDVHVQELAALEDYGTQNQFSAIGSIKPGWFRHTTVLMLLMAVDYAARHVFNKEDLAGVKTIHFARWVVLDGQRRVLFASNYDGSLESYMDDFIDKVAWGLNAVFSNGVGYPKTNWLIFDGAKDEQAFKNYIRVHQLPTQVWYSAYDHLTALNIASNARIRSGLTGDMSASEAEEWLRLL